MTIRKELKKRLLAFPRVWAVYQASKKRTKRLWMLRYFLNDAFNVYRHMYWSSRNKSSLQLTSELLFQYHKLEKGLVMPDPKRFFGEAPAKAVLNLLDIWHLKGMSREDPIYLGALETLHTYQHRLESELLDKEDRVLSMVRSFLHNYSIRTTSLVTPQFLVNLDGEENTSFHLFEQLVSVRRSVRSFSSKEVPITKIEHAVQLAQLSPSACNRQPCRIYLIRDEGRKKALLALQNGNRGFGHLIPTLAVITSDSGAFFDASERHEPYVDGGLFSMSLMYALSSQGLATCCLNWCVSPEQDKTMRTMLPLEGSELVIMFMAIGYPEPNALVPRSPRKSTECVMIEVC